MTAKSFRVGWVYTVVGGLGGVGLGVGSAQP